MIEKLYAALAALSRVCGFETVDRFPRGHAHARTHWERAYFDIASDLSPEQIERAMCEAIANTPIVFAHIIHPTPRMQRALLAVIEARVRRASGHAGELAALLIAAYASPATQEALPGMRAAIDETADEEPRVRIARTLAFLAQMHTPYGVIESGP